MIGTQGLVNSEEVEAAFRIPAVAQQIANLSPDELRALANILAEMLRRDMLIEQERFRRVARS
jgi:GTP-sensing pleiotropic transcriptional regulator CodY